MKRSDKAAFCSFNIVAWCMLPEYFLIFAQPIIVLTMTDKLTPEQRHRCMSLIRSWNTKPEILVRKYLFACGFRFRINVRKLPGTPDIVLPKYRTVIFVNGCFWHGHEGCRFYVLPKSNTEFWKAKIGRNRERDHKNMVALRDLGWHVVQIWECQLKPKKREETLLGLVFALSRIMLINYSARTYVLPEEEETTDNMVAEDGVQ